MRLLSREGMRDVDIGICWDAGYIGICGIGGEDGGYAEIWGICGDMGDMRRYGGYAEICGTDHLPEIGPVGLPFLDQPPPIHERRETGMANDLRAEKRMLILYLTC